MRTMKGSQEVPESDKASGDNAGLDEFIRVRRAAGPFPSRETAPGGFDPVGRPGEGDDTAVLAFGAEGKEVVEVPLLLSVTQLVALESEAQRRGLTVARLLRGVIGAFLAAAFRGSGEGVPRGAGQRG